METNTADTAILIERPRTGDRPAWNALFDRYRGRLRRMVEIRLDARLQSGIDASDLIQEVYVDIASRLDEYVRDPKLTPFLWLGLVVGERMMRLHRHHLGARMRDAGREFSLYRGALPAANSAALAAQLLRRHTSPTQAVLRAERPCGPVAAALRGADAAARPPHDSAVVARASHPTRVVGLSGAGLPNPPRGPGVPGARLTPVRVCSRSCRVGATHRRNALAFGGLHPPYGDERPP
jgi:RNA polymerase sigma-70 factor (ECF subfamily)